MVLDVDGEARCCRLVEDFFYFLLAAGWGLHVELNIGMPCTGCFIGYSGRGMMIFWICAGILVCVAGGGCIIVVSLVWGIVIDCFCRLREVVI